jgi:hypothetical protein
MRKSYSLSLLLLLILVGFYFYSRSKPAVLNSAPKIKFAPLVIHRRYEMFPNQLKIKFLKSMDCPQLGINLENLKLTTLFPWNLAAQMISVIYGLKLLSPGPGIMKRTELKIISMIRSVQE